MTSLQKTTDYKNIIIYGKKVVSTKKRHAILYFIF